MPTPDILEFLDLKQYMRAWLAALPYPEVTRALRWAGAQVGLSREQMWNLFLGGPEHGISADAVPAFARLFGLDDHRSEYLRRQVYSRDAPPDEVRQARLQVWEMHAAATGVPAEAIATALEADPQPGADEAATLVMLPLLAAHARADRPAQVVQLLTGGPDLGAVTRAMEAARAGLALGEARGPRMVRLAPPARPNDWETGAWVGLLGHARDRLLRSSPYDVRHVLIIGCIDGIAAAETSRAQRRLGTAIREILRQTAEKPLGRLFGVLTEQVRLTDLSGRVDGHPFAGPVGQGSVLHPSESAIKARESATSSTPPGRPCLYHHVTLSSYARDWIAWRKAHNRPASAAWFARGLGLKRSQAHAILSGAARFLPEHVSAMARVLDLDVEEAAYLEGVARYELATDPLDKGRELLALTSYASARDVTTMTGQQLRAFSHWGGAAIRALADLPDFLANPAWITRKLGGRISMADAKMLTQALLRTGVLVPQPAGPPRPANAETWVKNAHEALSSVLYQHSGMRLMQGELRLPRQDQDFQGQVIAVPADARPRITQALLTCREEVRQAWSEAEQRARAGQGSLDRVVAFGLQLFPLTPDLNPRR